MSATLDLFGDRPRRKRRVMMHVIDAGDCGCYSDDGVNDIARFQCRRCGYESKWMPVKSITDGKRGRPCPRCNGPEDEIAAGVINVVHQHFCLAPNVIVTPQTELASLGDEVGGFDSLDQAELAMAMECDFGCSIDDDAMARVVTVADLVALARSAIAANALANRRSDRSVRVERPVGHQEN